MRKSNIIRLKFYGVRGSLPSPPTKDMIEEKLYYLIKKSQGEKFCDDESIRKFIREQPLVRKSIIGGNTSCVYINIKNTHIILDAGSGIRELGKDLMEQEFGAGEGEAHIFLSHTHWDHIMGFPFFLPAFITGNEINFYGVHTQLEQRISNQQEGEYFPKPLNSMGSEISFTHLRKEKKININKINIKNTRLEHPGGSYGYRLQFKGKVIVYATDSEYTNLSKLKTEQYKQFFKNADILIYDAQFTLAESIEKENWGHSTSIQGVKFANALNVKHLILFHHDPYYSDEKLLSILADAKEYHRLNMINNDLKISLAMEGMEINL